MLKIQNVSVTVANQTIISELNLNLKIGQLLALMGPNGSGKTTLAQALLGNPDYPITKGKLNLNGKNLIPLSPENRAQLGLFVSFQNPPAVAGVSLMAYLREAVKAREKESFNFDSFYRNLLAGLKMLRLKPEFLERSLNESFSGGERKKVEVLSILLLKPRYLVLDEVDTGLDIDTLKLIGHILNKLRDKCGVILITHSQKILDYLPADTIHILINGTLVTPDKRKILTILERRGYAAFRQSRI